MCGILGYTGERQASDILLSGLAKLEYRGYDSAGIAVLDGENIKVAKNKGRLKVLSEKIAAASVIRAGQHTENLPTSTPTLYGATTWQ